MNLIILNSLVSFAAIVMLRHNILKSWAQSLDCTAALTKLNTRRRWASEVAHFLNSPNSKVMNFFQWKFKTFCDTLLICNNNVIIIMEANQVFKMIWFSMFFDSTDKFTGPIVFVHLFKLCSQLKDQRRQKSWTKQSKSTKWKSKTDD